MTLKEVPVVPGRMRPVLGDVADISIDSLPGEFDRSGPRRFITVNANIYKKDLGKATTDVQNAVNSIGYSQYDGSEQGGHTLTDVAGPLPCRDPSESPADAEGCDRPVASDGGWVDQRNSTASNSRAESR